MRFAVAVCSVLAALACRAAVAFTFDQSATTIESAFGGLSGQQAFAAWARRHGRVYSSPQEAAHRQRVFLDNAERVLLLNSQPGRKSKLGLNGLADLTREEFKAKMIMPQPLQLPEASEAALSKPGPTHFSWRYEHVKPAPAVDWRAVEPPIMGPVRSQHANNASCGSCFAFATVGIAEASNALYTGKVVPGSEQQIIDCDDKHDHGCSGGDFHNALDYVIYNKGLTTEENWPYLGREDKCDRKKEKDHQVKVDDWESVPPFNETALMQALTMRPVVSAICCGANLDDWHHYMGGVFDMPCCSNQLVLDHAIVLAGYGTSEDGEEYYILKNSWSEDWGEKGYMRIARNVGPPKSNWVSQCGLASMPTMVFRGPKPPPPSEDDGGSGSSTASALLPARQQAAQQHQQVQALRHEAEGDLQAWFMSRLPRFMLPHRHRHA